MDEGMPSWMDMDFMQGMLRRSEQDDTIEVIDMHSEPATSKGDNYTSDMYRIHLEWTQTKAQKTQKKSVILKMAPREESTRRELIKKSNMFIVEIDMTTNTLEKMNEIVGKNHRFNAMTYLVEREYPSFLILEDLAPLGFCMAHRKLGLDLEHCLIVMRSLAKFHASSAVLCEREQSHKGLYKRGILNIENRGEITKMYEIMFKTFADEVETWPEIEPKYVRKLKELPKVVYEKAAKIVEPRDNEFNVINHGDVWVNNMLFRYNDEGKPISHIFVDFQMSIYSSPAIDLHYFLSMSPSPKVYEESREFLLEEYSRTLASCLKEYGYKGAIPTIDELQRYMREREFYAMVSSCILLPTVLVDKKKVAGLSDMIRKDGTYSNPGFKSETYRKLIVKRIPYFEERGLLDN